MSKFAPNDYPSAAATHFAGGAISQVTGRTLQKSYFYREAA